LIIGSGGNLGKAHHRKRLLKLAKVWHLRPSFCNWLIATVSSFLDQHPDNVDAPLAKRSQ
jgi:hypothetical protein